MIRCRRKLPTGALLVSFVGLQRRGARQRARRTWRSHQTRSAGELLRGDPIGTSRRFTTWFAGTTSLRVTGSALIGSGSHRGSSPSDFLWHGAFLGYLRLNWRYAGFFLYPYVLLAAMGIVALVGGIAAGNLSSSALVGAALAAALFAGLLQWPARRLFVQHLLDDWIFARRYIHGEDAVLGPRLDRVAERLCKAARSGEADEVLVLGHSLGAVLVIDVLDRALRLEPSLGQDGSAVAFISVGSSIPKIGLHRAAARFRAAVERVANAPAIFWGEYQTLTDVMNFYKVDPVTDMGLKGRSPLIRRVRVKSMLHPAAYRRIKRNLFRVHCQFVSANDRRAAYDYFMLLCGPLSAENQARSRDGGGSANPPAVEVARAR